MEGARLSFSPPIFDCIGLEALQTFFDTHLAQGSPDPCRTLSVTVMWTSVHLRNAEKLFFFLHLGPMSAFIFKWILFRFRLKKSDFKGTFHVCKVSVAVLMSSVRAMDNILHKLMDETSTFIYAWWSRPLCDGNQQIQEKKKNSAMKSWPSTFSVGLWVFFLMPILWTVKTRHHFPLVCILFLRTIAAFLTRCQPINSCLPAPFRAQTWLIL